MKKKVTLGIYCLYPTLLAIIFLLLGEYVFFNSDDFYSYFIFCYLLPVCGFIYFVRKRPFNQWLLFLGFIPAPLPIFIYEYHHSGWWQYMGTHVASSFYSAPFVIISLIIALILTLSDKLKKL